MRTVLACFTVLSLATLFLSGCQSPDPRDQQPGADTGARWQASGNTRVDTETAIDALQQGEIQAAQRLLEGALDHNSPDPRAASLMRQITRDPRELLGEESFLYNIQPGDNLAIIARRYLGDPLLFVALARYNGIDNPSRIFVGTDIRVPGSEAETQDVEQKAPSANDDSGTPMVSSAVDDSAVTDTVSASDSEAPGVPEQPTTAAASSLQAPFQKGDYRQVLELAALPLSDTEKKWVRQSAGKIAEQREDLGNYAAALESVILGIELAGANTQLTDHLARLTNKNQAQVLLDEALQSNSPGQQYEALARATDLSPKIVELDARYLAMRDQLVEELHKRAMLAFRQQKLDPAITLWDRILRIDADNDLAIVHKSRAEFLKKKLSDLN